MIREIFLLQNPWRKDSGFFFPAFSRQIEAELLKNLDNNKILGLIGSRQVGKTSLLYRLIQHLIRNKVSSADVFYFNLDDLKLHELFNNIVDFVQFIGKDGNRKYLFIDEVQRLENPGLFLKEIYDLNLNYKIIYSGSSQLEIKSKLKENLVGRARVLQINCLNISEIAEFMRPAAKQDVFKHAMLYGSYPGVCLEKSDIDKKLIIKDIYQSYLQKDIIDFLKVQNSQAFNHLLILLAGQSGSLLNIDALSNALKVNRNEVKRYVDMLEETFIIKRIFPYFRNYKKEIIKTPKIFLLDNGLYNFIINNFNPFERRNDIGVLFENFILSEFVKRDLYSMRKINFWRTTNQTEIDFIVQDGSKLSAFEVKWNKTAIPKSFKTFSTCYPEAMCDLINKDNFEEFLEDFYRDGN